MRMKMFAAKNFDDAKALIAAEMGADAIILSEREIDGGVEVRAATDKMGGGMVPNEPLFMSRCADSAGQTTSENPLGARMRDALRWHGAPMSFARRVIDAGLRDAPGMNPEAAIEAGLASVLGLDPLPEYPERNVILVGAPGHGRTATAAKLARRASVAGAELFPLAADLDATAGGDQLAAYLERERGRIRVARQPDDLFALLRAARAAGERCVIDLPAISPFDHEDMARLVDLLSAIDAEPVLVFSSEGHPDDQAEAARVFAKAGIQRAILTKLDIARRRGGAVAALGSAGIALSHLASTPFIGGGLARADASALAGLLLEESPGHVARKGAA